MRTTVLLLAIGLVLVSADAPSVRLAGAVVERRAWAMGTALTIAVSAPTHSTAWRESEAVLAAVERADALLSTWRAGTELDRLNRQPAGSAATVSPVLASLLEEVWRWWRDTDGSFDPGVGPLVDAWGVRSERRQPSPDELARALAESGLRRFRLDPRHRAVTRLVPGAWLDSGGFGKGAALRSVQAALSAAGVRQALVNFGGQVLVLGSDPRDPRSHGWVVGVAHPAHRDVAVRELILRDRSASTSGQSEHPGHILDPHTGHPVPPWGSVTVVAQDPMVADILSTALFVMGPERGLEWARARRDVGALFLIQRGDAVEARWNPAMEPYLRERR